MIRKIILISNFEVRCRKHPEERNLREVKNIRVQDDGTGQYRLFGNRRNGFGAFNTGGTIQFDYGLKTIKFANGIGEAAAQFLLNKHKEQSLPTQQNYS